MEFLPSNKFTCFLLSILTMWCLSLAFAANGQEQSDAVASYQKGLEFYKAGQYQQAVDALKRSIKLNPHAPDPYYYLGDVYFLSGQYKEAVKSYKQAIKLKPDYAVAYNNLGTAYHKLGDFKEAVLAYNHAIQINPDYPEANYGLGIAYLEMKETGKAIEQHKILSKIDQGRADKLYKYIDEQQSLVILNGKAISIPAPTYPTVARAAQASGVVQVWVIVDEKGEVVSATAVTGHPLLRQVATEAAYHARFTPTTANGKPVKINGLITYNFIFR